MSFGYPRSKQDKSIPEYINIPNYKLLRKLGKGAFGIVYEAENILTGTKVAIKILERREPFIEERNALIEMSSSPFCNENIACMLEYGNINSKDYIITELMDGDIYNLITKKIKGPLDNGILINGILHLLTGLNDIHKRGFAHQDIKPENILYKDNGNILKITDLGMLCTRSGHKHITNCKVTGSLLYIAPDIAAGMPKSPISLKQAQKGDIWALGLVFFEMAHGHTALLNDEKLYRLKDVAMTQQSDVDTKKHSIDFINTLIEKMIRVNPNERATSQEALNFFKASLDYKLNYPQLDVDGASSAANTDNGSKPQLDVDIIKVETTNAIVDAVREGVLDEYKNNQLRYNTPSFGNLTPKSRSLFENAGYIYNIANDDEDLIDDDILLSRISEIKNLRNSYTERSNKTLIYDRELIIYSTIIRKPKRYNW